MDEEHEMTTVLNSFDSSFGILQDIKHLPRVRVKQLLGKLTKEVDTEDFSVDIELPRIQNIIAFLYFLLEDYENVKEYTNKTKEQKADNINCKVIIGHCHLKEGEFYEGMQMCAQLEQLRGNLFEMLLAKAEMAFTYSRFGMEMFEKAETIYEDVLKSEYLQNVPVCYVGLWKFGLALTMKRALNIHNLHEYNKSLYQEQRFTAIVKLFNEIIAIEDVKALKCKARACVEIAFLLDETRNFPDCLKAIYPPGCQQMQRDSGWYINRALELCPNDIFVLERSGKYFRYKNDLKKSIEVLTKAVSIRSTAFGHHHLALSLRKQIEIPAEMITSLRGRHRGSYTRRRDFSQRRPPCSRRLFEKRLGQKDDVSDLHNVSTFPEPTWNTENSTNTMTSLCLEPDGKVDTGQYNGPSHTRKPTKSFGDPNIAPSEGNIDAMMTISRNDASDLCVKMRADNVDNVCTALSSMHLREYTKHVPRNMYRRRQRQREYNCYSDRNVDESRYTEAKRGYSIRQVDEGPTTRKHEPSYASFLHMHTDSNEEDLDDRYELHPERSISTTTISSSMANMIKSPKKIRKLNPSDITDKILHHLEVSYEIGDNISALYDKGLTLRKLSRTDEALDVFKAIIRNKKASLMQRANSYEQAAYCLDEKGVETNNQQRREKHEFDIKMYLKKSIEVGCTIIANDPSLSDCRESVTTLKSLLQGKAKNKDTLKELAFVYENMKRYKEAIGCYKEIEAMEEGQTRDVHVILNLVRTCMMDKDYSEAVVSLDMIMCLPEAILKIDAKLYLSTYIEGGMHAVKTGDFGIAGMRFRKALDYGKSYAKVAEKTELSHDNQPIPEDDDNSFDVYIYSSQSSEEKWKILKDILMHIGVRTTHNSDNMTPGSMEFRGMIGNIQLSTHFIIALENEEADSDRIDQMFTDQIIRERTQKRISNIVTVREAEEIQIPAELRIFQSVVVRPNTQYAESSELSPETLDSVKDLLYKLSNPMH